MTTKYKYMYGLTVTRNLFRLKKINDGIRLSVASSTKRNLLIKLDTFQFLPGVFLITSRKSPLWRQAITYVVIFCDVTKESPTSSSMVSGGEGKRWIKRLKTLFSPYISRLLIRIMLFFNIWQTILPESYFYSGRCPFNDPLSLILSKVW